MDVYVCHRERRWAEKRRISLTCMPGVTVGWHPIFGVTKDEANFDQKYAPITRQKSEWNLAKHRCEILPIIGFHLISVWIYAKMGLGEAK